MNAYTAYNIIQQLSLSQKDKKELIDLLNGVDVNERVKKGVISVTWAKNDFQKRLLSRNSSD